MRVSEKPGSSSTAPHNSLTHADQSWRCKEDSVTPPIHAPQHDSHATQGAPTASAHRVGLVR